MISIAICSHNRSEDVALCLSALASQLPGRTDELLIVDSCSSPEHAASLESLASAYQGQLIRLETPGLSGARNGALAAARGDWVAYLDDDTIPLPDWLSSLHRVIDDCDSRLAAVGGLTQPLWPDSETAPSHISPRWLFYLSCNQDHVRGNVTHGAKVCGANLAFRRETLSSVGGFRVELGRMGDRLIGGEESLVVRLLLQRGLNVIYDPAVRVKHRIHRERLTLEWIRKRAYWEGVTETAIATADGGPFPAKLALPKLAVSAIVFGALYALTRNTDFLIRSRTAGGALAARLKPPTALSPAVANAAKAKANA